MKEEESNPPNENFIDHDLGSISVHFGAFVRTFAVNTFNTLVPKLLDAV